MHALTIHQPWAWAIAAGHKRVENRTWSTTYRGPLVIHAGNSRESLSEGLEFLASLDIHPTEDMVYGACLAVAILSDVVPFNDPQRALFDESSIATDPFAFGPQCWVLSEVRRLDETIPMRGQQLLFDVPADVEREIKRHAPDQVSHHRKGRVAR